ncbi:MAG TPA: prephenate dehydratase [Lacipirellulaceae bacterium]|nr:prephenate dehydratase [Lacipirellulaceae bacterium]
MAKRKNKSPRQNSIAKRPDVEMRRRADSESRPVRPSSQTVASLRNELDRIDGEILSAINRRGAIAKEIGQLKHSAGKCVYDAQREAEVLERATANNAGPLSDDAVRAIFRELISGTRAVQLPIRVAYLGPEYTFSHLAAIERFGQSTELVPVGTIAAVFEEVERGQAQFGVVPMENSTDGRVSDTLDCFSRSHVRICGELPLRIHHCLLGVGHRDQVHTVYSKPQPLSQCRNWLARHLPHANVVEVSSTAEAARRSKGEPTSAAVASAQAAVNYELPVLVSNIEDNPDNITRFAIISAETAGRSGNDKTALMVEIAHEPGALADAMAIFKRNRLNMTWIESFPIPGSRGRYLFFVEFEAHANDPAARRAIARLEEKSLRLEVLGSYAQMEPVG